MTEVLTPSRLAAARQALAEAKGAHALLVDELRDTHDPKRLEASRARVRAAEADVADAQIADDATSQREREAATASVAKGRALAWSSVDRLGRECVPLSQVLQADLEEFVASVFSYVEANDRRYDAMPADARTKRPPFTTGAAIWAVVERQLFVRSHGKVGRSGKTVYAAGQQPNVAEVERDIAAYVASKKEIPQ